MANFVQEIQECLTPDLIWFIFYTVMGNSILEIIDSASYYLWTYVVITLLVACAIYFTLRLKGVQFSMIGEMVKLLTQSGRVAQDSEDTTSKTSGCDAPKKCKRVNSFQAFAISLASRVGTGNLAGVASAIFIGGPGAVFWMWLMAFLGSGTAFVEATLAQIYKKRGEDAFYGGPAYYMEQGLHKRWLGIIFAILITMTFGLANQMVQSNTLCTAIANTCQINIVWVGVVLTIATLVIIFGGVQRISRFSAIVVPVMAVGYVVIAIVVILLNIKILPDILALILKNAFGFEQAMGGAVGVAILQGVKRGLFSNEAGEGSAPNAAATAHITHPVKQGLLQSLGVFTDTLLICTCTAFIVLVAGLYHGDADGIELTTQSLEAEIGPVGRYFITAAIFFFAYSSIIGNYFYGETNIRFVTKSQSAVFVFRLLNACVVLAGTFLTLQETFSIVDLLMGLMTICNLIAITLLAGKVFILLDDYKAQLKAGKDPVFHKSILSDDEAKDIECWD